MKCVNCPPSRLWNHIFDQHVTRFLMSRSYLVTINAFCQYKHIVFHYSTLLALLLSDFTKLNNLTSIILISYRDKYIFVKPVFAVKKFANIFVLSFILTAGK